MEKTRDHTLPIVLFVEDEPFVRLAGADLLENAGFAVVEARNADEALRILESRLDVQVVFTDVDMPGSLDGLALARCVRERWPQIGVIVTSGRHLVPTNALPHDNAFMLKPYAGATLLRRIQEIMQRNSA
jgi:CheY-like chemotaxis protein